MAHIETKRDQVVQCSTCGRILEPVHLCYNCDIKPDLVNAEQQGLSAGNAGYNFGGHFTASQIDVIKKQVEKWDLTKTVTKAVEELNELSVELLHLLRGKPSNHLEEIADCFIALQHLEIKFGYCQNFINNKVGKGEPKL